MGGPDSLQATRPANIADDEWQLRIKLAACYRLFEWLNWTDSIFNHITVRVPGPKRHFLINPFGLYYSEITASNLVKIDIEGNNVGDSNYPVNRAGFVIHSAIHAVREDAHCIMHTHTTDGMAVSCKADGLAYNNFYGAALEGKIAYHDFEGITVHDDEKARLVASLGNKNVLILRNHGLLTCGSTLGRAFSTLRWLQRACEVQVVTDSMKGKDIQLDSATRGKSAAVALNFDRMEEQNGREFEALVRRMEVVKRGEYGWVDYRS
ncbi:MAG: class II aldolase/adducin family protein [Betaproteobacteria bacterium]|nr:class II aldolase/adducin family protein [Betaproteobacteria bacterium]